MFWTLWAMLVFFCKFTSMQQYLSLTLCHKRNYIQLTFTWCGVACISCCQCCPASSCWIEVPLFWYFVWYELICDTIPQEQNMIAMPNKQFGRENGHAPLFWSFILPCSFLFFFLEPWCLKDIVNVWYMIAMPKKESGKENDHGWVFDGLFCQLLSPFPFSFITVLGEYAKGNEYGCHASQTIWEGESPYPRGMLIHITVFFPFSCYFYHCVLRAIQKGIE